MSDQEILTRLRRFLLLFSVAIFAGSLLELAVLNHTQEALQWAPILLSILGIALNGWVILRPGQKALRALNMEMALVIFGSVVGSLVHIRGNLEFAIEINPGLDLWQSIMAVLGGVNPLLAPGVLAMAAVISLASAYRLPARLSREG